MKYESNKNEKEIKKIKNNSKLIEKNFNNLHKI